jgi:hypothetical protein
MLEQQMGRRPPGLPDGCQHRGPVVRVDGGKIGVEVDVTAALADSGDAAGLVRAGQLVGRNEKPPRAHVRNALNVFELPFEQLLSRQGGGWLKIFKRAGRFHGHCSCDDPQGWPACQPAGVNSSFIRLAVELSGADASTHGGGLVPTLD